MYVFGGGAVTDWRDSSHDIREPLFGIYGLQNKDRIRALAGNFDYNGDGTKMISFSFGTGNVEPKARLVEWSLSTAYDPNSRGSSPSTIKSLTSAQFETAMGLDFGNFYYLDWILPL